MTTKGKENLDFSADIKKLQLSDYNKKCFDCGELGTTYFVVNFGTFVCSKCAGILRELNFKVKGINVSIFTEKEKRIAEIMGNERARRIFLGKFDKLKIKAPSNSDNSYKKFLKDKYINKLFFVRHREFKFVNDILEESEDEEEESEEEEEEESGSYEEEEESEEEEQSEESEKKNNEESTNKKKHNFTKLEDMNIKKPTDEKTKNWQKLWKDNYGLNVQLKPEDLEFVTNDNLL